MPKFGVNIGDYLDPAAILIPAAKADGNDYGAGRASADAWLKHKEVTDEIVFPDIIDPEVIEVPSIGEQIFEQPIIEDIMIGGDMPMIDPIVDPVMPAAAPEIAPEVVPDSIVVPLADGAMVRIDRSGKIIGRM